MKKNKMITADDVILSAEKSIRKKFNLLATSQAESFVKFREENPELSKSIIDYCDFAMKNKRNFQAFSEVGKQLTKTFDFPNTDNSYNFVFNNALCGKNNPLYTALDATFDASLLVEDGKARLYANLYNLYQNTRKIMDGFYIFYVKPFFYYVDAYQGIILRCEEYPILNFDPALFREESEYVYYGDTVLYTPYDGLEGYWNLATYNKKSGGKKGTVYKYITFSRECSIDEHGGKCFYMPAHQVIALCWHGLPILKYCVHPCSLLTIDHRDNNAKNNDIRNLAILARVNNTRKGKIGEDGFDFIFFFNLMRMSIYPFGYFS